MEIAWNLIDGFLNKHIKYLTILHKKYQTQIFCLLIFTPGKLTHFQWMASK